MPSPVSERIARRIETEVIGRTLLKDEIARIVDDEVKLLLGAIEALAAHASWSPDAANDIRTALALVQHQATGMGDNPAGAPGK